MSEWKATHEQQRRDIKAGYRYLWPPRVTERWADEFEAALVQRGAEARQRFEKAQEADDE